MGNRRQIVTYVTAKANSLLYAVAEQDYMDSAVARRLIWPEMLDRLLYI
jgi:hypothetical protein